MELKRYTVMQVHVLTLYMYTYKKLTHLWQYAVASNLNQ